MLNSINLHFAIVHRAKKGMSKRLLSKKVWKDAIGAASKPKRLHLSADKYGLFSCPVKNCDSESYNSQRGCRKHVYQRHGWFYFFDEKPNIENVLPQHAIASKTMTKPKRSRTTEIPMFFKDCNFDKNFKLWLCSPVGGLKSYKQSSQVSCKVLKFLKFCCQDCCSKWDIPMNIVDYCVGSIASISDFIDYLKDKWAVGYAGIIGYMNSLSHVLDYRRMADNKLNDTFVASEIYIDRVKKTLARKMRCEWNVLLSVDYLTKINCWASLDEMQLVIPHHAERFAQIISNISHENYNPPAHDLSFCTAFLTAIFFLLVKASRPMTFQYLTVEMVNNIDGNGMIDQTAFKTMERYGFDTLIFTKETQNIVNGYIQCIRPQLNPVCDYVLVTKNGTQLSRLSDVFGRLVFQAIGKYINPTRYRQIIETESAKKLTLEEQSVLSEDQKHTSFVARVHYQKMQSRDIATRGKKVMDRLRDEQPSKDVLMKINEVLPKAKIFECPEISRENNLPNKNNSNSGQRQKKVAFSKIEDKFLKLGIQKYGCSWSKIVADPEYSFHSSRKAATLCRRAQTCKFT